MHASIPDTQLLDRWRTRRDADAFAELVSRYGPLVYSACLRVLRCRTAAEDAAQDCFVELFQSRARVRSLPCYLHVTATHRALDRLKAEKRRGEREARFAAAQPEAVHPNWDELSAMVDEAIAQLPEKLRLPVVLRFLQSKTYAEIASEAGLPVSTVQYRLNQGIEGIRSHLGKRGIAVGASALATMLAAAPSHALPPTAAAKLGTLALAGGGAAALPTIATFTLGGILAMKSTITVIMVIGAATLAATLFLKSDTPESASIAPPTTAPPALPEAEPLVSPTPLDVAEVVPEPSPTLDNTETPVPPLGSMAGRVFTAEGEPLAEWTVMARFEEQQTQVLTNEIGEFLLENLPPGDYVVTAALPKSGLHAELDRDSIQLHAGESITGLEAIWQTGPLTLSGYVTRDDGAPVANIVMSTYYAFESDKGQEVQQLETKTGEDGRYTFTGFPDVPELSVNVEVKVEGCFPIHRSEVALDGHEEDFVVERAPTISGWVRDAKTREPVTAFRLDHWPAQGEELSTEEMDLFAFVSREELKIDADGAFSFNAGGYETIRIGVSAPGYVTGLKILFGVEPGAVVENVEVLLHHAPPFSGIVVDEGGAGIADARIYLGYPMLIHANSRTAVGIRGSEGVTTTDDDGTFTITEYPPTLNVVSAHSKGYAPAWTEVSSTSPSRITLTRGATVEGSVTLDGAPIGSRFVKVSVELDNPDMMFATAEADGSFRLEHVPPGLVGISANLPLDEFTQSIKRQTTLVNGDTQRIDFDFDTQSAAYLEGVVLLDGEPLETARLLAKATLANGDQVTYWIDAQSDGTYRLGPVIAGVYEFGLVGIPMRDGATRFPEPETVVLQEGETVKQDLLYTSP